MTGRTIVLAGALTLLAAGAGLPQTPMFKSGVNVVNFTVTVTDHDGHYLTGLTPDDFRVEEDGRPQTIQYFAAGVPEGPERRRCISACCSIPARAWPTTSSSRGRPSSSS